MEENKNTVDKEKDINSEVSTNEEVSSENEETSSGYQSSNGLGYQDGMTRKEKAEAASHDVAEVVARGLGRYFGGAAGGAAVDKALSTEAGQKILRSASKRVARAPIARGMLASNQKNISRAKPIAHKAIDRAGSKTKGASKSGVADGKTTSGSSLSNTSSKSGSSFSSTGTGGKKSSNYSIVLILVFVFLICLIFFMTVFITPLMNLGIIDINDIGSGFDGSTNIGFTNVSSKNSHWWPIGSSDTTTKNGVTYASGVPMVVTVTSHYNAMEDFRGESHNGLDIGNDGNGSGVVNVIATKDGKVIYPSSNSQTSYNDNGYYGNPDGGGFGNYVIIEHSDGTSTVYAHLSKNSVTVFAGDTVKQGQVIGKMGNSGSSTGTHLHFEVRVNGNRVNPSNYISSSNARPKVGSMNYIDGESNKQSICLTLKSTGFSDNAVAALLTNIKHESSFNPNVLGDNGTSYGLCQWHEERYDNLKTTYPYSYKTIDSQLEFLMYELENEYISVYNALDKGTDSTSDLTYNFCANFEIPYDTKNTCKNRANNSDSYYDYVKNGCK